MHCWIGSDCGVAFVAVPEWEKDSRLVKRVAELKKPKTLAQLKKDLDTVFNKFIRQRDSKEGYFICISCNEEKPISQMHAGHFYSAGQFSNVRHDEDNVNGQCNYCNTFLHGNLLNYREGLLKKIGPERFKVLEIRKHNFNKMGKFEVELLISEYKKKLHPWATERNKNNKTMKDKTYAYKMGYDCGLNGSTLTNCAFGIFSSQENTKEWERGKKDAEKIKAAQAQAKAPQFQK